MKNPEKIFLGVMRHGQCKSSDFLSEARAMSGDELTAEGKSESRFRSHLAGRAALLRLLKIAGVSGKVIANSEFGFLQFVEASGCDSGRYFVNVSHSDSIAVVACSTVPVGVDTEKISRSVESVFSRIATQEEVAAIQKVPTLEFAGGQVVSTKILLWSAKEALSKAVGLGMRGGMTNYRFAIDRSHFWLAQFVGASPNVLKFPATKFLVFEDHEIAVSSDANLLRSGVELLVL